MGPRRTVSHCLHVRRQYNILRSLIETHFYYMVSLCRPAQRGPCANMTGTIRYDYEVAAHGLAAQLDVGILRGPTLLWSWVGIRLLRDAGGA